MPLVEIARPVEGVAVVTLNRPDALNALSIDLRRSLVLVLDELAADDSCDAVVLTGAGRAFCAGLDLRELGVDAGGLTLDGDGDVVAAVERMPGAVIAAVNGPCVTGGFELALACDFILASDRATFADTHAFVGVLPGWGLSQRLSRLIGVGRAKELSLTGRFVTAAEAERWGLVNRVVPHDTLRNAAVEMAATMMRAAPGMIRRYKRLIDDGFGMPFALALKEERARSDAFNATINADEIDRRREAVRSRGQQQVGNR